MPALLDVHWDSWDFLPLWFFFPTYLCLIMPPTVVPYACLIPLCLLLPQPACLTLPTWFACACRTLSLLFLGGGLHVVHSVPFFYHHLCLLGGCYCFWFCWVPPLPCPLPILFHAHLCACLPPLCSLWMDSLPAFPCSYLLLPSHPMCSSCPPFPCPCLPFSPPLVSDLSFLPHTGGWGPHLFSRWVRGGDLVLPQATVGLPCLPCLPSVKLYCFA